jgi:uncharacterized membrane protein (UPF0127 family)
MAWACASAAADEALKSLPLSFVTSAGTSSFTAEIADTPETKQHGLMYRETMADDAAMLFVYKPPGTASFWMENTKLPLDMIFVQPDGAIKAIAQDAVPMSEDVITVPGPVSAVIEVKAGTARRLGLKKGDHVEGPAFDLTK